jgi:tetratricopeptide (TPR) repeat protein
MMHERHEHIMELFNAAAELPPRERGAFLDDACGDDAPLRAEVESLLVHDGATRSALDSPLLGTGFNVTQIADADPALEANLPERIGPYRVLGILGVGNMGVVYRAQQEKPTRAVAVKVMHPGRVSKGLRRRFLDEMESLARLQHPGIAQIYAAGEESTTTGTRPYIAMELVAGRPLPAYLAERQLGTGARLALLARICDAVQHAHQHGVIHRDLKPANILIEEGDDGPRPRILDFGVARIVDRGMGTATAATQPGQLVGTLAYMSPEQVSAAPDEIDTRSDVYALGVIGYELLCGRLPIDVGTTSLYAGMHAILDQTPKPLAAYARQFRGDLSHIFAKALAKRKEDRYDSASVLAADLRSFLEHRPITARPPSAADVLTKLARRHRLAVAALVLGIGLAGLGLVRAHLARRALQAHYIETRDIASFLVRDFTDKLDEIGGTDEVRRDLLRRLRTHIERLLVQDPRDLKLQTAHADVLKSLSDVEFSAGHQDAALELRAQALAIRRCVVALSPGDPDRQADLSIALVLVGDVLHDRGDFARALALYAEALTIDEALVRHDAGSHRLRSNLLWSYIRLTQLAYQQGDLDRVERWAERAVHMQDTILALNPEDTDALHARVCLEQLRSDIAADEGQRAATLEHTGDALRYARQLLAQAPTNCVYQRDCAGALLNAGTRALRQKDFAAAEESLREATAVLEHLARLDPNDQETRRILSGAYWTSSRLALACGDIPAAAAPADEACTLAAQLVAQNPNVVRYARDLIQADMHRAHVALLQDDAADARIHCQRAADLSLRLAEDPRIKAQDVVYYGRCLLELPVADLQDVDSAMAIAERALAATANQLPEAWELLAKCHRARSHMARARECYEQMLVHLPADAVEQRERVDKTLASLPADTSTE